MSTSSSVMISVRAPQGLVVGRADSVRGRQIGFWLDVPLVLGAHLEFRLELPGADDTVLGWLEIDGGQNPSHRKDQAHYQAHVDTIDKGDLEPFERWLHDTEMGRVPQDLRGNILQRNALAQQQAEEEAQQEAEEQARIEARRARLERLANPVEDPPEPLFFHDILNSTTPTPHSKPSGDAAGIRGATLGSLAGWLDSLAHQHAPSHAHEQALQRQQQLQALLEAVEGPPPPAESVPAPQPAPPVLAPLPAPEPPAPEPQAPPPPTVAVDLLGDGVHPTLAVGWSSAQAFRTGPLGDLLGGFLRLKRDHLSTWPARTHAQIIMPHGRDLQGEATLIQLDDASVMYQLTLPTVDRRRLQAEALH